MFSLNSKFSQLLVFVIVVVSFPALATAQVRSRVPRPGLDPFQSLKRLELPQLDRQPLVRHRMKKATFSYPYQVQMQLGLRRMNQQRFIPQEFKPIVPRKVTPEKRPLNQNDLFWRGKPTDSEPRP